MRGQSVAGFVEWLVGRALADGYGPRWTGSISRDMLGIVAARRSGDSAEILAVLRRTKRKQPNAG